MVELRGISKTFPSNGAIALEKADFTLLPGEIHGLLGENGTGKSTLMHIMAGFLTPSSGTIVVDGKQRRFSSSAGALAQGIGMVRQYPGYIRGFKVWEDCILGAERADHPDKKVPPAWRNLFSQKLLDPVRSKRRLEELSDRWDFQLPLEGQAESLTVSQRQKAAVLSLLLRDVRWFIFDEPTAVLTPGESASLFELFKGLRSEGRGIAFITHKLDEALSLTDRVTVIRRGITMEARKTNCLSVETLKASIFGSGGISSGKSVINTTTPGPVTRSFHPVPLGGKKPLLEIKDLQVELPPLPFIRNVSLRLEPGRILGIAGVRDSGLDTLEMAATGFPGLPAMNRSFLSGRHNKAVKIQGQVMLNGTQICGRGAKAFRDAGGAYLGADRLGNSLAQQLPVKESLIIHAFRRARLSSPMGIFGFLDMKYLDSWCESIMSRCGIARSVSNRASSFSGGMLQRILLAREFSEDAPLMILSEPGSGLDHKNLEKLEEALRNHARKGGGALLFSTDVEELLSVVDEIMVLRNGTITARFVLRPSAVKDEGNGEGSGLSFTELRAGINTAMTG